MVEAYQVPFYDRSNTTPCHSRFQRRLYTLTTEFVQISSVAFRKSSIHVDIHVLGFGHEFPFWPAVFFTFEVSFWVPQ
jgi:hypothetical protein